ncbi:MAG: SdrD B-like domain-containing protein, partial [Methanothrix sp.]|nr:SdrD B-like domain-containing protein [Methanothrix sp.]
FGNNQLAISGLKFHDKNANGQRDADEPPISGWDIQLKDESDNLLQTVATSFEPGKEGTYEFVDLQPGTYRVYEAQRNGWVRTAPAEEYYTVTLTNMPSRGNLFGNVIASGFSGAKFEDLNGNGAKDSDEPGLAGWTIKLLKDGTEIASTQTHSGGAYSFVDIAPGSYTVEEVPQDGWTQSYPSTGTYAITLISGVPGPTDLDFGNYRTNFSGMKFEDSNGNGAKDGDEPGLEGWTIKLMKGATEVASTQTGPGGAYSFTGIAPGSYTVEEMAQSSWTQSYPASPGTYSLNLLSGVAGPIDIDFGNFWSTSLSGMKFDDRNGNSVKDSGEAGLEGWTIKLMKEGAQVASTVTGADGSYSFTSLAPGSYTVEETAQDGWIQTYPPAPGTHSVTLVSGENGPTDLDFGNWETTVFSGMKFEDSNANGLKDSGEPGLEGWTIKLMKEGTEVASTKTGTDGTYSFDGVAPGSYTVEEVPQEGWIQTSPAGDVYTAVSSSGQVKITRADQSDVAATEVNFGNRKLYEVFQVEITADQQTVLPGQQLVFYININRDSNIDLNSFTVEYTLPKGLNFVDSNHSPLSVTQNADGTTTIIWTFTAFSSQMAAQVAGSQSVSESPTEAIASSTSITVTTEVQPDAPQSLTGTVVVTGTSSEAAIAEAKGSVSVNVEKMPVQPILLNKTSDLKEVWPGATVGYTITYESLLKQAYLNDVVITEQASSDLIFLSASPAPDAGTDNVWSIGRLAPGQKGTINVFFQVKNTTNLSFLSQSSVSGSGFTNSYRRLSTETESQGLRNSVTLTSKEFTPVTTSYFVKLRDSYGTSLLKTEHGSGDYSSDEISAMQMQNRSISTAGSLKAIFRPTSFLLPGGKSINYDSEIASSTITRNRATLASTSNSVRYAKSLEMDEKILVDKNETSISVEGSLQGQAHLGVLKKDSQAVKPSPVFESSQDYTGAFRFNESMQDYGSNVLLIRNATGQGQVASDQRLKKSQRSYEHGNGSYQSEELISSAESYMTKDLSVSSDPQYG